MGSCRIPKPRDPEAAARAEVIGLMFDYIDRVRAHFEHVAGEHGLTAVQAKVMLMLGDPCPMRRLADSLRCDPSNITGVVARLRSRGLVTSVEGPGDRRVKLLRPTREGGRLRDAFETSLFRDVPGMNGLERSQLSGMRAALVTLCGDSNSSS